MLKYQIAGTRIVTAPKIISIQNIERGMVRRALKFAEKIALIIEGCFHSIANELTIYILCSGEYISMVGLTLDGKGYMELNIWRNYDASVYLVCLWPC